jgi:hypothetical protein
MLTEDQKAEMCKELDACHAYREQLSLYEQQALLNYAKGKQQFLADRPEDEQAYFRAMNPAYDLADVVAALLATPAAEAARAATAKLIAEPPKLSLRQVALLYIYTGQQIPNSEANTIAQAHGHTSGEKLYKHYNSLAQIEDRTHISGRAVKPLIEDVQAVISQLSGQQRQYAESELKTLKSKIIDRS